MPFRWYQLVRRDDLGTAAVWKYDKLTKGALSALVFTIEAQNGGTKNLNNPVFENVKEIAIKDGAYVAWSLPGPLARAQTVFNGDKLQETNWSEYADAWQWDKFVPQLGDYLGDPAKYLSLGDMSNPVIEVDWDEANVQTAGANGILSDSGRINAHALIDTELSGRAPQGFYRSRKIDDFTSLVSGDHDVTLDVDFPVRSLFLRSKKNDSGPDEGISQVKLGFDADTYIPLQEYVEDAMRRNVHEFNLDTHFGNRVFTKHDQDIHAPLGYVQSAQMLGSGTGTRFAYINYLIPCTARVAIFDSAGTAVTSYETWFVDWQGFVPYSTVGWRWGWPFTATPMLAANRYKKGVFRLTQAEASHAVTVGLEQLAVQP
jgi:hypothetical protein